MQNRYYVAENPQAAPYSSTVREWVERPSVLQSGTEWRSREVARFKTTAEATRHASRKNKSA